MARTNVKTQGEGGHLQAKESDRAEINPADVSISFLVSRIVRKHSAIVEATQSVVLCYVSPHKLTQVAYKPQSE